MCSLSCGRADDRPQTAPLTVPGLRLLGGPEAGIAGRVNRAAARPGGGLWLAGDGQLSAWLEGGSAIGYRSAQTAWLRDGRVTSLAAGGGCVWAGTPTGIARLGGERPLWFGPADLPDSRVTVLAAAAPGTPDLLLGTWGGAACSFGAAVPQPLGHAAPVLCLLAEGGMAWIGFADGAVVRARLGPQAGQSSVRLDADLPGGARALWRAPLGSPWIADGEGGLWRVEGVRATLEAQVPMAVAHLAEDDDGCLWLGAADGVYTRAGGEVARVDGPRAAVTAVVPGPGGRIWVATWGEGLWTCAGTTCDRVGSLAAGRLHSLAVDVAGRVWVSGDAGLFRCGTECAAVDDPEIAATGPLGPLAVDGQDVWAGSPSGGGVVRVREGEVTRFGPDRRLPAGPIHALAAESASDAVWLATGDGLFRFDGTQFVPRRLGADAAAALSLAWDPSGDLWVGLMDGLARLRPGPAGGTELVDTGGEAVRALAVGPDGSVWAGTRAGLRRWRGGGRADPFGTGDGLPDANVRDLDVGPDGALWVATSGGLARLRDGVWRVYNQAQGLPSDVIWAVHVDRAGGVWVGTFGGGAARFDGERFWRVSSAQGLASNVVRQVLDDRNGDLWLVTDVGLARLPLAALPALPGRAWAGWPLAAAGGLAVLLLALARALARRIRAACGARR